MWGEKRRKKTTTMASSLSLVSFVQSIGPGQSALYLALDANA